MSLLGYPGTADYASTAALFLPHVWNTHWKQSIQECRALSLYGNALETALLKIVPVMHTPSAISASYCTEPPQSCSDFLVLCAGIFSYEFCISLEAKIGEFDALVQTDGTDVVPLSDLFIQECSRSDWLRLIIRSIDAHLRSSNTGDHSLHFELDGTSDDIVQQITLKGRDLRRAWRQNRITSSWRPADNAFSPHQPGAPMVFHGINTRSLTGASIDDLCNVVGRLCREFSAGVRLHRRKRSALGPGRSPQEAEHQLARYITCPLKTREPSQHYLTTSESYRVNRTILEECLLYGKCCRASGRVAGVFAIAFEQEASEEEQPGSRETPKEKKGNRGFSGIKRETKQQSANLPSRRCPVLRKGLPLFAIPLRVVARIRESERRRMQYIDILVELNLIQQSVVNSLLRYWRGHLTGVLTGRIRSRSVSKLGPPAWPSKLAY
ncbi:hypothetical protein V8E54_006017 [Elaphomyces granulatus]